MTADSTTIDEAIAAYDALEADFYRALEHLEALHAKGLAGFEDYVIAHEIGVRLCANGEHLIDRIKKALASL